MSARRSTGLFVALTLLFGVLAATPAALAHEERAATFPDGKGSVPTYRAFPQAQRLVVCKADSAQRIAKLSGAAKTRSSQLLGECKYRHVQDAINAVTKPGTTIYLLPGVYSEEPYAAPPTGECADLKVETEGDLVGTLQESVAPSEGGTPALLSYAQQVKCPHVHNLIAILGDTTPTDANGRCDGPLCRLQIEGTGAKAEDVIIDNKFAKLNGIRADRADGVYFRNFLVQQTEFNGIYVLETDGFVIDKVTARANDEYGFLTFASDHGLYKDCEAYYNGDSGVYPGSASDLNGDRTDISVGRYAIEITGCYSHHNALGYSGTAGNSVYAHDNVFAYNATGITTDSFFPDHPGLPQDHARFSRNKIFSNNINYYENIRKGICDKPLKERNILRDGIVCPVIPVPVGTGVWIAGGNFNLTDNNWIYDNWRWGLFQIWVPAALRNEFDPSKQYDTSNGNQYRNNILGKSPDGKVLHNGLDVWWDDEGGGNCWQDNVSSHGEVTYNEPSPQGLPDCDSGGSVFTPGTSAVKFNEFLTCAQFNRNDPLFRDPPNCSFFQTPTKPASDGSAPPAAGGAGAAPPAGGGSAGAGTDSGGVQPVAAVRGRGSLADTGLGVGVGLLGAALLLGAAWLRRSSRA